MKSLLLLVCAFILSATGYTQTIPVKKWVVSGIESVDNNPANEDPDSQIKILEITKSTGNNSYSGTVKYGNSLPVTDPCTIKITGKNISIVTEKQTWTGEVLETSGDKMKFMLGTLVYDFKLVPVPRRTRSTPPKYTVNQFSGSWVETMRTDNRNNNIGINNDDTIYIRVIKDSVFYLPGSKYLPLYGNVEISQGDNLGLSVVDYQVRSVTGEMMVLDDYNNTIHSFRKITGPFSFEVKKKMPVANIDLSAKSIINSWFVYSITPAQASENDHAIASLNIVEKNSETSFSGNVEFGNWKLKNFKTLPCNLTITGNNLSIDSKEFTWNGQIYKANGDTLVFGKEKELMYYLKKNEAVIPLIVDTGTFLIDLRPGTLINNWYVYKPEANPGFITPGIRILRELNIIKQLDSMKYNGKVTFDYLGKRNIQDCTIDFSGDLRSGSWANIITEGYSWKIEIFKVDGKEMIMGKKSDGIRYYFAKY